MHGNRSLNKTDVFHDQMMLKAAASMSMGHGPGLSKHLHNILHNLDVATIVVDHNFDVIYFTPSSCRFFNMTALNFSQSFTLSFYRTFDPHLVADLQTLLDGGDVDPREVLAHNGGRFSRRVLTSVGPNNRVNGFFISYLEVSGQHSAVARMFQDFLEGVPDAMLVGDPDGVIKYVNTEACRLFGYEPQEFVGLQIEDLIPIRFRDGHLAHLRNYWTYPPAETMGMDLQLIGQGKDRREFPVEISLCPVRIGEELFACAAVRDISTRKVFEKKLAEVLRRAELKRENAYETSQHLKRAIDKLLLTEASLLNLFQSIPEQVWLKDSDGVYICCNRKFEEFANLKEADIVGKRDHEIFGRQEADYYRLKDLEAAALGKPFKYEKWVTFVSDGRQELMEIIKNPLLDGEGQLIGILGVAREITERKLNEQRIDNLLSFQKTILKNAPIGVSVFGNDHICVECNDTFADIFGFKSNELIGNSFRVLYRDEETFLDINTKVWQAIQQGGVFTREVPMRHKDGSEIWVRQVAQLVDAETESTKAIVVMDDITDSKSFLVKLAEAKQHAEQANRSKSRFLSAASHDLRQPLQTIGLLQAVLDRKIKDAEVKSVVKQIGKTLKTMSDMLDSLLDINRLEDGNIKPESEVFPIDDILQLLYTEFTPHAAAKGLKLKVMFNNVVVKSDPHLLEQILRNLISNAIKYTKRGGVLVGCRRRGSSVRLEVWDTGIGIPKAQLSTIFDEFHQIENDAKESGRGLGIGLAIVQRSSELLGAKVNVRSVLDRGSVFWVELPICSQSVEPDTESNPEDQSNVQVRPVSVLLVEDDQEVLGTLQTLLELDGFRVIPADSPIAALSGLRHAAGAIDLILTDFNLPEGINGLELIRLVRQELGLKLPAIVLTGDISTVTEHSVVAERSILLRKPVNDHDLTALIVDLTKTAPLPVSSDGRASPVARRPIRPAVSFIDDDADIRFSMFRYFEAIDWPVRLFPSAESFLAATPRPDAELEDGCIVTDLLMEGMNGIDLIEHLNKDHWHVPVIVLTGRGDIATAVKAMRAGAVDILEKPFRGEALEAAILQALRKNADAAKPDGVDNSISTLTSREREVMDCVIAGQANKMIAFTLGISQRTVEHHRRKMMSKVGASTLPDLVRIAIRNGCC